jgi:rRNA maturation endonuclease Nob1
MSLDAGTNLFMQRADAERDALGQKKAAESAASCRFVCLRCGERFPFNIDGCPECGSQDIETLDQ